MAESTELQTLTIDPKIIEALVLYGDLKKLTSTQTVDYYNFKCYQAGLDPAAKPFDLLELNGKRILYANAGCSQQLTANRKLSHQVTNREMVDGIYCVFVRVAGPDGRSTENMGAVTMGNLQGEAKANAMMKATTKAIRRSVLAHCGLGVMDEAEVETIPGAKRIDFPALGVTLETRPGDAPVPFDEQDPGIEWTKEDREAALLNVSDFATALVDAGFGDDDIAKHTTKVAAKIGDPEITPKTWHNRFNTYWTRTIKTDLEPGGH